MIRMKPAVRVRKAASGKTSKEILDKLDKYLDDKEDGVVRMLCGFWGDQQDAISYDDLRQIVASGYISVETLQEWQQDYSYLVEQRLSDVWQEAMQYGANSQPIVTSSGFTFNMMYSGASEWIKDHGAEFVTNSTVQQQKAISSLLQLEMLNNHSVDEVAKLIRPCIGLTKGQTEAARNYYDTVKAQLLKDHPRMKVANAEAKAQKAAQRYAERMHRQRAQTIAVTEMAKAYNQGAHQGILAAQKAGYIGAVQKVWRTAGGDACPHCEALEGKAVGIDGGFGWSKYLFQDSDELPPAHPNCRCAVEYVEVEEPALTGRGIGYDDFWPEADVPDLEGDDKMALNYYVSFDGYKMNSALRSGGYEALTKDQQTIYNDLEKLIDKLPKCSGSTLNRSIFFYDDDGAKACYNGYKVGEAFTAGQFFSTTKNFMHNENAQVQMYIQGATNGAVLGRHGVEGENEVLYGPSAKFQVMSKYQMLGKYYIFLTEVMP